ncbi:MAG: acyl-[acyl-carrier-protein] thioesterase [Oscillospiraceae bacterium]|jgi:medium-chain acyl-[acyl-carrier-protein] hydrolase
MSNGYKKGFSVGFSDCDLYGCIRPSALLRMLESAAGQHEEKKHRSIFSLREEKNITWLLVRVRYSLKRPLRAKDRFFISTTTRPTKNVFFYRDFDILDEDGEHIGEASSLWVISGKDKHRILQPAWLHKLGVFDEYGNSLRTQRLARLHMPREMYPGRPVRFGYSDTDMNGHVTNTRYADVACDSIGLDIAPPRYVSEIQLDYNAECFAGEELFLENVLDGEIAYVRGSLAGKTRFNVKMRLAAL